ncbi:MAG: D-alanine--D-alanine ligase family protein [Thermodesulfobacteriota bacterium]
MPNLSFRSSITPIGEIASRLKVGLVFNDPYFSGMGVYKGAEEDVLREVEAVFKALEESGHVVEPIPVTDDFSNFFNLISSKNLDVVFNLCERMWDDSWGEILMAHMLEINEISFTGSDPKALWLALNKDKTKTVLNLFGIRTPSFKLFATEKDALDVREPSRLSSTQAQSNDDLNFPLIIKPNLEDGSLGIDSSSVIWDIKSLRKKVRALIKEFKRPVIVEEYINGREFNVSFLGDTALAVGEVEFKLPQVEPKVVTYKAKWDRDSNEYKNTITVCPANLNKKTERRIKDIALKATRAIGCRDYARVDMRMDSLGKIYVIEVNPNPDISPESGFSKALKAAGISYKAFVNQVVGFAIQRKKAKYYDSNSKELGNTG